GCDEAVVAATPRVVAVDEELLILASRRDDNRPVTIDSSQDLTKEPADLDCFLDVTPVGVQVIVETFEFVLRQSLNQLMRELLDFESISLLDFADDVDDLLTP